MGRLFCPCHGYTWTAAQSVAFPERLAAVKRGRGHHPSCRTGGVQIAKAVFGAVPSVIDASRIMRRIYQGGIPPTGRLARHAGFDVVVLAAAEYQPPAHQFPGVAVYHIPLRDDPTRPLSSRDAERIRTLTELLVRHHRRGDRILITCAAGLNRSGIITASTVRRLTGAPHKKIVDVIRARRSPQALSNREFVAAFKHRHLGSVGLV